MSDIRGEVRDINFWKSDPFLCHAAVYDGERSPYKCGSK